mmetsp:Transcript_28481/g.32584  ORF Transcript_28481/g.32584 Transcript_28481/m.32584 type:complete len:172 (+) Transcript_28481:40-555(+)|eukprot:CAMPEP_0115045486 /NCGR_PEP_ID=MMETSP0216-20121206/48179_1 /TAXON_ID=223996 /ORGANISM="Protocruzia adherens, Strain Boccale" /LENGTH=171 /DNA_ID=CAMNT_0002428379 /DNA_START=30 /DNA_END=545 /DNA_ORIENTATION=-
MEPRDDNRMKKRQRNQLDSLNAVEEDLKRLKLIENSYNTSDRKREIDLFGGNPPQISDSLMSTGDSPQKGRRVGGTERPNRVHQRNSSTPDISNDDVEISAPTTEYEGVNAALRQIRHENIVLRSNSISQNQLAQSNNIEMSGDSTYEGEPDQSYEHVNTYLRDVQFGFYQ